MLYLNLIIFSLVLAFIFKTSHQQMTYGACLNDGSNPDQTLGCEPRDMLIKLDLPNNSYFHVSPEHVTVQRCGGSCNLVERHKSCIPSASGKIQKNIPVWLYPVPGVSGPVDPECSVVTLEEHTECECGCAITRDSCAPSQLFQESECACICKDQAAKNACYDRTGYLWDEASCQCLCKPINEWPICPTGFLFDAINTCTCISVTNDPQTELAGPVLIITTLVLISGIATVAASLFHCYRRKVGLFGRKRREEIMENIRKTSEELSKADMFTLPLVEENKSKLLTTTTTSPPPPNP